MTLYTRFGDAGKTQRCDGSVVAKSDPQVCAIGELDELNAFLGLCAAEAHKSKREPLAGRIEQLQRELFNLGVAVAGMAVISESAVGRIESWIDEAWAPLPGLEQFILPGGTELAARLHVARTVARRAERNASALPDLAPIILKYLNRLGDLLFAWAWAEAEHPTTESP